MADVMVPTLVYMPVIFGIGRGIILALFIATLYFPKRVIRDQALSWHYAMGSKILVFLIAGWVCMLWSPRVARRS